MKAPQNKLTSKSLPGMVIFATILIYLCLACGTAIGTGKIRARFTEPRGTYITWWVKIPNPAPAAVLVNQYIRPGTKILESSHPVSSYDSEKGLAKWLLTGIKPGKLKMFMKIDKPILKKGQIKGEIIFQDQNANTIASVFMKNKRAKKKAIEGC